MLYNTDLLDLETRTRDTFSLLESMDRISRTYTKPHPTTTPLIESAEYGAFVVRYSDLVKLSEEYDISIQDSLDSLMYTHQLRPNELIVSLEEWRPYVNQNILYEFTNKYVLIPEIDTPAYRLCEACMESFLETGDYSWLDFYLECPNFLLEAGFDVSKAGATNARQRKKLARAAQGGINGKLEDLQATAKTLADEKAKYEAIANNIKLSDSERQAAMNAVALKTKDLENYNKAIANIQTKQQSRSGNFVKEIVKDPTTGKEIAVDKRDAKGNKIVNSDEQILSSMTPEQKKLYLREKHKSIQDRVMDKVNNGPSWLSQKWTALKNWWNRAGQSDSNNAGWFSNLVGKFKNFMGFNNQNNTNTNQVDKQAAQAAQKAENTEKQAEETAKKAAEQQVQQAQNDANQTQGQQQPAQTENKPATPPTTSTAQPAETKPETTQPKPSTQS